MTFTDVPSKSSATDGKVGLEVKRNATLRVNEDNAAEAKSLTSSLVTF